MTNRRLALAIVLFFASFPACLQSQIRLSVGAGAGIAGSTDETLSNGTTGWIVAGQITSSVLPLFQLGAEGNYLRNSGGHTEFVTGIAQLHIPVVPFFVKIGAGYGHADLRNHSTVAQGTAFELGAGYALGLPLIPIGVNVFANALLAYGPARSAQLVDAGLAISIP